jgi:hypothetical protein
MANTFQFIQSVTVGAGNAANIEFTSIPATYSDLVIKISARTTGSNLTAYIDYNNSTSNQTWQRLYNSSGTAGYDTNTRQLMQITDDGGSYNSSIFASTEIYIPKYAGDKIKTSSVETVVVNDGTPYILQVIANRWSDTSAISSIKITPNAGSMKQYSTAYLYGIKNS